MEQILIDANVIAKYLSSQEGILVSILGSYTLQVSPVAITELLASTAAEDPKEHKKVVDFINKNFVVINTTPEIAQIAGDLVRQLEITLAQALVAATAINTDTPLLTYDMQTFDVIPDLKLIEI